MPIEKFQTALQLIDRISVEVGLGQQNQPYSSSDSAVNQLTYLLNTAGQELLSMANWEILQDQFQFTTNSNIFPNGDYPLPANFDHMIEQTHWDRNNRLPLYGPLSPQDWQYLIGRDLVSHTIYASFREKEGKMYLFPTPPPDGLLIQYEYMSRGWVQDGGDPDTYHDSVQGPADVVQYDPPMIIAFVKLKFYEARGFDTTKAEGAFNRAFNSAVSRDVSAPVLSASGTMRSYPYLDGMRNTPDTGYGQ